MGKVEEFVIQKHSRAGQVHWDLMLRAGQVLETYRLELGPEELLDRPCTAVRIFDHPLRFLTYEGAVNAGAGNVKIADTGTYSLLTESENKKQLQLDGCILKGRFILTQIENDKWQFRRCR